MANETVTIETPDAAALESSASLQLVVARGMQIVDDDMYAIAGEELKAARAKIKELNEKRLAITRPMDEAKRRIMDLFNPALDKLDEASTLIAGAMSLYYDAKERAAKEARRLAEDEAAKQRAHLAAEARRKEEEAKALAAEAAKTTGATAQQAQLEAAAKETEARNLAQQATMVVAAPPPEIARPKSAGAAPAKVWDFEVVSLLDLAKWVVAHPDEISLLRANETSLRAKVRSMGENFNVDGVRATHTTSMRSSR